MAFIREFLRERARLLLPVRILRSRGPLIIGTVVFVDDNAVGIAVANISELKGRVIVIPLRKIVSVS